MTIHTRALARVAANLRWIEDRDWQLDFSPEDTEAMASLTETLRDFVARGPRLDFSDPNVKTATATARLIRKIQRMRERALALGHLDLLS